VWTDDFLHREAGVADIPRAAIEAQGKLVMLSATVAAARRAHPTDDLLSLLVEVEFEGRPLTDAEIIGMCILLISGGHETTAKLIANGVRLFATHPDQRAELATGTTPMAMAVEELLRFTSPTQYMARTTTRPVELHGTTIPAGEKVLLLLGSGNRDPREFDAPDVFDVHRPNTRILALGHGAHVCLGAAVVRLEARVALEEFLARYPEYDVDESGVEYMHSGNVQGPSSVPVRVPVAVG
jgi:cytochrome P450